MQTQRNELNFKGQNIYAGIDVHKKNWNVTIMSEVLEHKTFSQPPKAEVLYGYLIRNFPGATYYSAYEAGFCGFELHRKLQSLGIQNIVVNPADIPTTQKEKVNKTDARDSRKIARSLRDGDLTGIYIPSRRAQEDRSLLRGRYAITKDLRREKVRIKSLLNFYGIEAPEQFSDKSYWSKCYINWLRTVEMDYETGKNSLDILIRGVEEFRKLQLEITLKIRKLSTSEKYSGDYEIISSIPGIGLITGMTFLTEIEDINRFSDTDHFAAFVGLIPKCHSSGEKQSDGEITFRRHFLLRTMLIESAWTAAGKDPALHLSFVKLCRRMEANKAIIRISRKLLNRIYYMLKRKEKYVCGTVNQKLSNT